MISDRANVGRLATAFAALLGVLSVGVGPARAADEVAFGDPSATAVFGSGVTFTQPVTAPDVEARYVEILIVRPSTIGPEVHAISQVGNISSSTFEYSLREESQHLYPNTRFSARWRIVDTAGNVYLGPQTNITYADTRFPWQTASGKLVSVHWYKGDEAFGKRALAIGEAGVAKAEELFGATETEPVDFYVYADIQAFYGALGPATRENVGGEALADIRTLFALITPDQINESWVGIVIPHELTHLVFDTAVRNPFHFPPRWFNEGLAVYLTQGLDGGDRQLVREAVRAGEIIPLSGLAGQFPTRRDKLALAYAESASALDFMVRKYGREAVVKLVHSYAAGVTDDAALSGAFGVDTQGFNDAWFADIGARSPLPQGPQPDPAGPLPSGWSASPAPTPSVALPPPTVAPPSPAATAPTASSSGAPNPSSNTPGSVPLPTLGGAPSPPPVPTAAVPASPAPPAVTPGVIAQPPAVTRTSNVGLAWLFGLLAVVLAVVGVGLLAIRRRSPAPR